MQESEIKEVQLILKRILCNIADDILESKYLLYFDIDSGAYIGRIGNDKYIIEAKYDDEEEIKNRDN